MDGGSLMSAVAQGSESPTLEQNGLKVDQDALRRWTTAEEKKCGIKLWEGEKIQWLPLDQITHVEVDFSKKGDTEFLAMAAMFFGFGCFIIYMSGKPTDFSLGHAFVLAGLICVALFHFLKEQLLIARFGSSSKEIEVSKKLDKNTDIESSSVYRDATKVLQHIERVRKAKQSV